MPLLKALLQYAMDLPAVFPLITFFKHKSAMGRKKDAVLLVKKHEAYA